MMRLVVPVLLGATATTGSAMAGPRMAPRQAARLTASALAAVFISITVSAWVIALEFLAHQPLTSPFLGWCRQALGLHAAPSRLLGFSALGLAILTTACTGRTWCQWRRQRGVGLSRVHIIPSATPVAFAQTGSTGGVVVSTGMLDALDVAEQQALFSHEQAHLAHRHDRYEFVGRASSYLVPLLPAVRRLRLALERWADEEAALEVGDRELVARAVAKAALASHAYAAPPLGIAGSNVPRRVAALLEPPRHAAFVSWFASAAVLVAVISATFQVHQLMVMFSAICPG